MIDEAVALTEFNRLADFDGFHRLTKESAQDYIWAIQNADTLEIATRVIDDIKADPEREGLPTSAIIRGLMNDENMRHQKPVGDYEHWRAEAAREAERTDPAALERERRCIELLAIKCKMGSRMPPELRAELVNLLK